jgi:hypothetical protein
VSVDSYGWCLFVRGDQVHREDGPAQITRSNQGTWKGWVQHNRCHNLDGPALVTEDVRGKPVRPLLPEAFVYFVGGRGVEKDLWEELRTLARRGVPADEVALWARITGDRSGGRTTINGKPFTRKGDCLATVRAMVAAGVPAGYVTQLQEARVGNADIIKYYSAGVPVEEALKQAAAQAGQ